MSAPQPDEWPEIVRLIRSYARRRFGFDPTGLTILSPYQGVYASLPFPPENGHVLAAQPSTNGATTPTRQP